MIQEVGKFELLASFVCCLIKNRFNSGSDYQRMIKSTYINEYRDFIFGTSLASKYAHAEIPVLNPINTNT